MIQDSWMLADTPEEAAYHLAAAMGCCDPVHSAPRESVPDRIVQQ